MSGWGGKEGSQPLLRSDDTLDGPSPRSPPLGSTSQDLQLPDHLPRLCSLGNHDSVLVTGRIGRLQTSERLMAFTDAVLAIICTSCAVPLWANGTRSFNAIRLVPFITTFLILSRLWEKHCQDFSRVASVDEWLAQTNVMWIASLSILPFSFVVTMVPTTINGHIVYLALWVATMGMVGLTSFLLSRAARRLARLARNSREYQGWQRRDLALTVALVEVGVVVLVSSLLAWRNGLDILTEDYKGAFRPGHMSPSAIVWLVGLLAFWATLAGRFNFQLLSWWLGPDSPVLFDGRVPRVRVEIFSDGVYAASATGLMIELLSGLLRQEGEGHEAGGEAEEVRKGSVWPGLINYIYCFHIVAVLHRSHQNVVAKIPAFDQNLPAINALVCLAVAFIPTLSNIINASWDHDPAALLAAAAFLLCASLLLLGLLKAALKRAPVSADLVGIHENPDALLTEMLGRPFGNGIISGFVAPHPLGEAGGEAEAAGENGSRASGSDEGNFYMPPLHHAPRLFNDPSCLPRDGPRDPELLRRLQGIRDDYEVGSACILPAMSLLLTVLTLGVHLSGAYSPYVPLAFLLTFFVYSVERHLLRPRAARQIARIQRQLRPARQKSGRVLRPGGGGGGGGGSFLGPPRWSTGPSDLYVVHTHHSHLPPVLEAMSSAEDSSRASSDEAAAAEGGAAGDGEVKEEEGGATEKEAPAERHVHFSV